MKIGELARRTGCTTETIRLSACDAPATDCGAIDAVVDDHLGHVNARIEELRQLRAQLTALRERCGGDRPLERCGIMQGLTAMGRTSHPSKLTHVG
jgi:MerR, DNA binding